MTKPVLELRNITKRFPGVLANDHVDLSLEQGEVLALLGENGAGKTTLMNILYGLYRADEGEIVLRSRPLDIDSPVDAIGAGIGMVHQHFMLIPVFTVTENVMLGEEITRAGGFLNQEQVGEQVSQISQQYGLEVDPRSLVRDLPVGVQQRVEIIKLLYRQADILILDEPTAVLTPQEVGELFDIMRSLVRQGKSIIFITHKLGEVMEVADRITILRDGRVAGTVQPEHSSREQIAEMMVGHEVKLELDRIRGETADPVLVVKDLRVDDDKGQAAIDGVSFEVHAGEILGVAGVQGNGQTELVEAVTGLRRAAGGSIGLLGKEITAASPRKIAELGVAHIPEDRQRDGLVLPFSVMDNLILGSFYLPPFARHHVIRWDVCFAEAEELVKQFDVRAPGPLTQVGTLSGGNQQKVIVARELSRPIRLLVAAQPTRGLDVGSIEYIHTKLLEKRNNGAAILLVSTELDEIFQLSDRVAVIYRGQFIDVVPSEMATRESIGLLMAGVQSEETEQNQTLMGTDTPVSPQGNHDVR